MPASIKRLRDSWNVKPTARDKGLTLTIKVTAYDDGIPINESPEYDQGAGWLGVVSFVTSTLGEFRQHPTARRKKRAPGA